MRAIQLTFHNSTHAPLIKRYMPSGEFEFVGETESHSMDAPRFDPETDAELKALGGTDHQYNRDYKVGGSYKKCGFFSGRYAGESLTHDQLEAVLQWADCWKDFLTPVMWPNTLDGREATWYYGFQIKPVERTPRVKKVAERFEELAEDPEFVYQNPSTLVEAELTVPDVVFTDGAGLPEVDA